MKATLKIYQAKRGAQKGRWRWRVVARNGKIMANPGEGYVSIREMESSLESVFNAIGNHLYKEPSKSHERF